MGKFFYGIFTVIMAIVVFLIFYTPYIALAGNTLADSLYNPGFSWACHQKISRSLCMFKTTDGNYYVADCTKQSNEYIVNDNKIKSIKNEQGELGYKMPVCSRDIAIYGAMLIAAIIYPFMRKLDDKNVPPTIYLLLALVPIGLDGGLQLLSELGIRVFGAYESTNLIRTVTGAIAGFALPFYIFPLWNYYRSGKKNKKKK